MNDYLYLLDESQNPIGILSCQLPHACPYWEDIKTEQLEHGLLTLEFTVPFNHPTTTMIGNEGFVVRKNEENDAFELFRIKETTARKSEQSLSVFAENAAVTDLLGQIVRPIKLASNTIQQAMATVLQNTGWQLGQVDYVGVQDFSFDNYMTALVAVHQIMDQFHAEINFRVEFNGTKVTGKYIDMLQRRGDDTGKLFSYGRDLTDQVERIQDTKDLITALIGVGPNDSSGNPITFTSYNPSIPAGYEKQSDWIGNTVARDKWGSGGKHIFGVYQDEDAQNPFDLFNRTKSKLDELSQPRYTYNVGVLLLDKLTGYEAHRVRLGDGIQIQDKTFDPPLLLQARVIEKKTSIQDSTQNSVVLGDFVPVFSSMNSDIKKLQDQLKSITGVDETGKTLMNSPRIIVLDSNQESVADFDGVNRVIAVDKAIIGDIQSPVIPKFNALENTLNFTVSASGSDTTGDGTVGSPYASIQRALKDIPVINNGVATITLASTLNKEIRIQGFVGGGTIKVDFWNYTVNGNIAVTGCNNQIIFTSGHPTDYGFLNFAGTAPSGAMVKSTNNTFFQFEGIKLWGRNAVTTGFYNAGGSSMWIRLAQVAGVTGSAIFSQINARTFVNDVTGTGGTYGLRSTLAGVITGFGTAPTGVTANSLAENAGQIIGTFTFTTGTGTAPPIPPTVKNWGSSMARSYRVGIGWDSIPEAKQGSDWQNKYLHQGCWFFGSDPSATVTGKTIQRVRVNLTRKSSGGNGKATNAFIRYHTHTGQPGGAPTLSSTYVLVPFQWGDNKWVDLSLDNLNGNSFLTAFANGTAKGLAIYTSSADINEYMIFDDTVLIEFTY